MNQPAGAQVGLKLTGTGESNNVEVRFSAGYKLANGRYEVGQEINRGGPARPSPSRSFGDWRRWTTLLGIG